MKKYSLPFVCLMMTALMAVILSNNAFAAQECVNTLEPGLQQQANTPPTAGGNNQLTGQGAGVDIINGIFGAVDAIVAGIAQTFYTAVVQNPDYIAAVNSLIVLYVAVYGIMLLFNMASHKTGEVVSRLFKIAIVWAIMVNGWGFFNQFVGTPIINAMNQIIANFITAAGGTAGPDSVDAASGALNPVSVSLLAGPMTLMFSLRFVTVILALLSTGPFGWFFVLVILWSMLEFILMLIGAIITYIKSIVGLAFLFGIAPIFFAFILFEQSKRVFLGWANQVFGFFLLPVMLFAFLSFYIIMILNALETILFPPGTDLCHVVWLHFGIIDIWWWRFINAANPTGGDANGTWQGGPPIGIMDILYLLLLTHLGKNLSKFIEQLARDLSGGTGPGMVRSNDVGRWFSNHIPGVQGRGVAGLAAAGAGNVLSRSKSALDRTGVLGKFKRGGGPSGTPAAESNAEGGPTTNRTPASGTNNQSKIPSSQRQDGGENTRPGPKGQDPSTGRYVPLPGSNGTLEQWVPNKTDGSKGGNSGSNTGNKQQSQSQGGGQGQGGQGTQNNPSDPNGKPNPTDSNPAAKRVDGGDNTERDNARPETGNMSRGEVAKQDTIKAEDKAIKATETETAARQAAADETIARSPGGASRFVSWAAAGNTESDDS